MADNEGNAVDRLTYLLIGAGIGAAVALLFAPKAGHELRGDIADASRKGLDYTKDGARYVADRATDIYGQTSQKAVDLYEQGSAKAADLYAQTAQKAQDVVAAGKDTYASKREQLSAAISAGKDAYAEEKQRGGAVGTTAVSGATSATPSLPSGTPTPDNA